MTPAQPMWDDPGSREHHTAPRENPDQMGRAASKLLYQQFGLLENPFGVTPNPRYLYESNTHIEARSSLILGIECGVGFQALIAPPGMGKTTILFNLLEHFNATARTAFLFQSQGSSVDFLHQVISDFGGIAQEGADLTCLQDTINDLLLRERQQGRRTILIIDEAQNLGASVLETVRLLSNFETPDDKLLQIILAGQPELAQNLAQRQAAQLYQRISILATLTPFGLPDTNNYIAHRLKTAGYEGPPLFTPPAIKMIWEQSAGIPRRINTLCFNAMILAVANNEKQVEPHLLREVVADLDLNRIGSMVPGSRDDREPADSSLSFQSDETTPFSVHGENSESFVSEIVPDDRDENGTTVFVRDAITANALFAAAARHFDS
jgi:type II secretory pathway predicted ATPase ExeA